KGLLDTYKWHLYSIEFQKRGIPHAHIVLITKPDNVSINTRICAEIPEDKNSDLFKTITSTHLHTCGFYCNKNNTCRFKFPKPYSENTEFVAGEYPKYRRRKNGITHFARGILYTNQDVVPFNPYF
ncbi:MAG: hypothetical protein RLZZ546_2587, partial [Bacteroidota bacterium]